MQTAVVLLTTLSKCSTIMRQTKLGVMAQLVARLNGIQKVRGSNPLSSAKVRLALKSQTKGHHKTVSFLFAPYYFAAQQATAEGRRNNVSLHFVSLPLVALGTNPCLRQLRVAPTSRQRKRRENNSPFFLCLPQGPPFTGFGRGKTK